LNLDRAINGIFIEAGTMLSYTAGGRFIRAACESQPSSKVDEFIEQFTAWLPALWSDPPKIGVFSLPYIGPGFTIF
jgi:hypothetical protein